MPLLIKSLTVNTPSLIKILKIFLAFNFSCSLFEFPLSYNDFGPLLLHKIYSYRKECKGQCQSHRPGLVATVNMHNKFAFLYTTCIVMTNQYRVKKLGVAPE